MKPPNSPDPNSNTRLATALIKARDGGVPKSGIENVLARVSLLLTYLIMTVDRPPSTGHVTGANDRRHGQLQMDQDRLSCMKLLLRGVKLLW
jgi:hypothetical protein